VALLKSKKSMIARSDISFYFV